MGKLGWNSGYIGSDQRDTAVGAVGYDKYYLERLDGRFNPVLDTDPDAQAFFGRVIAAGGSLTTTEQIAITRLVLDMKSYSIWSKMKAIYPMVGASAAACAQNLKSSSFTGTFSSGWTFASTGVTGNGTSSYFNSNVNTLSNLNQNNTHLSFYCNNSNSDNTADSGTENYTIQYYGGSLYYRINTSSYVSLGTYSALGMTLGSRLTSTQQKLFKNGSIINTDNTTSLTPDNLNIYLGAINPGLFSTSRRYAFASIGDGLTDTEAADFYTCVNTFQVSLSRNV